MNNKKFSQRLLAWHKRHGRFDLPWQQNGDPYLVWLSEIMLQQTQVATVIPYFERFRTSFPDIRRLAEAPIDTVLHHWSGLGYYARARNLHRTAEILETKYGGQFPRSVEALTALPGIGESTAGAICAQAFGIRAPILDGNVKRVLARFHAVEGWPDQADVKRQLWGAGRDSHANKASGPLHSGNHGPRCHRLHTQSSSLHILSIEGGLPRPPARQNRLLSGQKGAPEPTSKGHPDASDSRTIRGGVAKATTTDGDLGWLMELA